MPVAARRDQRRRDVERDEEPEARRVHVERGRGQGIEAERAFEQHRRRGNRLMRDRAREDQTIHARRFEPRVAQRGARRVGRDVDQRLGRGDRALAHAGELLDRPRFEAVATVEFERRQARRRFRRAEAREREAIEWDRGRTCRASGNAFVNHEMSFACRTALSHPRNYGVLAFVTARLERPTASPRSRR